MKIINIDIDNKIILRSVEDTHSKTIESITSNLRLPTGNYQSILLNFNFISPKDNTLYYFANFETNKEKIDVKIESIKIDDKTYQNACYIPQEVFLKECKVNIGLYAYKLNNDETLSKRYSLEPIRDIVVKGSYDPNSKESIVPSATIFEVYFDKVDKAYITFNEYVEEFTNRIDELFNNANQGLKKYKHFNSVADMKADKTLISGYMVETLGYYEVNDGGGAKYIIRDKKEDDVEDNGSIHFVNDKLVAELVIENNTINAKSFGLKSDSNIDNTLFLQNAINFLNYKINLFIPDGVYHFYNTIDMTNLPDDVIIKCEGTLKYLGNDTFINLNVQNGNIYIKKIIGTYFDYEELPENDKSIAVNILSCGKSHITIDYISSFDKGISIIGDGTTKDDGSYLYTLRGTIYCTINSKFINCRKGVFITKNYGYVNENIFNLGWIKAYNAVEFEDNDTWWDPFNGNKFYDTGLETIENTGFLLSGCRRTLIIAPRFEMTNNKFIIEDETCSSNLYLLSYSCNKDYLDFNGIRRTVVGNNSDEVGDVVSHFEICGYKNNPIKINSFYHPKMDKNTIYFDEDVFDKDVFCRVKKSDGSTGVVKLDDTTPNEVIKVLSSTDGVVEQSITPKVKMVYVSTSNGEVNLKTTSSFEKTGNSFIVSCRYYTNPISISKSTGTKIIENLGSSGTFLLMYFDDIWQAIKISDNYFTM